MVSLDFGFGITFMGFALAEFCFRLGLGSLVRGVGFVLPLCVVGFGF